MFFISQFSYNGILHSIAVCALISNLLKTSHSNFSFTNISILFVLQQIYTPMLSFSCSLSTRHSIPFSTHSQLRNSGLWWTIFWENIYGLERRMHFRWKDSTANLPVTISVRVSFQQINQKKMRFTIKNPSTHQFKIVPNVSIIWLMQSIMYFIIINLSRL